MTGLLGILEQGIADKKRHASDKLENEQKKPKPGHT